MRTVEQLPGLPSFDYTDPALRGTSFHAAIDDLASRGWLARGPYGYIVLRREAGEHFLRSRSASFPGRALMELFQVREGPLREEMSRNILHIGGAEHRRLRSLLNPSLSPKAAERHRPAMRGLIAEVFEEALTGARSADAGRADAGRADAGRADAGGRSRRTVRCEAVEALAKPYPARAIAHVLGAPRQDAPRINHWSMWVQRQFDAASMMQEREQIEEATAELYEYLGRLLAQRREIPGEDLISTLLAAQQEGERLSEVECVNLVLDVLIGGVDTTQSQLGHALRLFACHPEQWALIAQRPELAEAAVEEVLRFEPVTPFTARIVEEEMSYRDVIFPAGTIVMVCAFAANRDMAGTAAGASADEFDITAQRPRARALTFGAGIHYCVGANLARVELEEALAFLAPRMPDLRPDGEPEYGSITGIYGLTRLPVAFSA